jgi:hypothetical protein
MTGAPIQRWAMYFCFSTGLVIENDLGRAEEREQLAGVRAADRVEVRLHALEESFLIAT